MSKAVCDNDCFNCKYDDCIKSDSDYEMQNRKEYYRNYYQKNKDKYREYNRAYREKHREELIAKAREYYRLHGNSKKNKEYAKVYYEAHKQEIYARQKARLDADPEQREKRKAYMKEYNQNYYKRKRKGIVNEVVPES